MSIQTKQRHIEVEELIGTGQAQTLVRTEALVPGVGREAIEALISDANLHITGSEAQADRVVIEGEVYCQAVYRQGEEASLKALTARMAFNHILEVEGSETGMTPRVTGRIEHVEAKYENGHMVFLVTVGLLAQVLKLTPEDIIEEIQGDDIQVNYIDVCSRKLAAEATAENIIRETVALPQALDARTSLMDWAIATVESVEPDLGGVRVKGRINVETLISSGVAGRPVAMLKYPINFDQLVEMPDWLTEDVHAEATLNQLETRVNEGAEGEDSELVMEAELSISVQAIITDRTQAVADLYSTGGITMKCQRRKLNVCNSIKRISSVETIKDTVLLNENAPGVGTVLAVRALPVISEWHSEGGRGTVEGILEVSVMYMPGGSDMLQATRTELPFEIEVPGELGDDSWVRIETASAEANAIMSDRLEIKATLALNAETRVNGEVSPVVSVDEGELIKKRPGIVLFWPGEGDSAWTIGKRYNLPVEKVVEMNGGTMAIEPGKAMVLRI